jgi:hypothetical protein
MIWKNCGSNFYFLVFGGVAGVIPRRGGSGKAVGFEAWGRLPPFYSVLMSVWRAEGLSKEIWSERFLKFKLGI